MGVILEREVRSHDQVSPQVEQNLYGVRLFLEGQHFPEAVEQYIEYQEKTHLAEGLALQQRTVRSLDVVNGRTQSFGGQTMVDTNQAGYLAAKKQYLRGDQPARRLMKRREHDVRISEDFDTLMAQGKIGEGFMVVSPYEEELDDATARRLGFWPENRRSYAWFYRKVSDDELECVDVSIDRSSLATYKKLLKGHGVDASQTEQSHDMPAHRVRFQASSAEERNAFIDNVLSQYRELNNDPTAMNANDAFEAVEFLDKHAQNHLRLIVDVHRGIANSLRTGNLDTLIRLSVSRALRELDCLDYQEVCALQDLLDAPQITPQHSPGLSTIIAAQRYGTWQAMSKLASGETSEVGPTYRGINRGIVGSIQAIQVMNHMYNNTNEAALQGRTMPGCAGGESFLKQSSEEVKSSIFKGEKYSFNKKMYCVVCQPSPKQEEKPKMCGPCGLCRTCDKKAGGAG